MFTKRTHLLFTCLLLMILTGLLAGCPGQPAGNESASTDTTASSVAQSELAADSMEQEYPEDTVAARPDFPVTCAVSFIGAQHTGEPGQLSDLSFTVNLTQDTKTLGSTRMDLSSAQPQAYAEFKLPEYMLVVTPVIDPPIDLGQGSYGSYGGYRIELDSPAGDPHAVFEVNKQAGISRADGQNGYQLNLMLAAPEEQLYTYALIAPEGSVAEPDLVLVIHPDSFEEMSATDSADGVYQYRFPALELKLFGKKLAADQDYMRAADTRAVTGGFNSGSGGGGLGSGGGRGGRRRGGG